MLGVQMIIAIKTKRNFRRLQRSLRSSKVRSPRLTIDGSTVTRSDIIRAKRSQQLRSGWREFLFDQPMQMLTYRWVIEPLDYFVEKSGD